MSSFVHTPLPPRRLSLLLTSAGSFIARSLIYIRKTQYLALYCPLHVYSQYHIHIQGCNMRWGCSQIFEGFVCVWRPSLMELGSLQNVLTLPVRDLPAVTWTRQPCSPIALFCNNLASQKLSSFTICVLNNCLVLQHWWRVYKTLYRLWFITAFTSARHLSISWARSIQIV
jgi:hypothetical protein